MRRRLPSLFVASLALSAAAADAVVSVGADHGCAIADDLSLQCWGANEQGQIGFDPGAVPAAFEPVYVPGLILDNVVDVAAGGAFTCALTELGEVVCFGSNGSGQLGDGSTVTQRATPGTVTGLASGARDVAAGSRHACAINAAGGAVCWGANRSGALGNGSNSDSGTPVPVTGLASGIVQIEASGDFDGDSFTCALSATGAVSCWGSGSRGQLGNGATSASNVPVAVTGLGPGVREIAVGLAHACALTQSGGVRCWGDNSDGQLGNGLFGAGQSENPTPVPVSGLDSGVAAIGVGDNHSCAITVAGAVKCWGLNFFGQRGDGTTRAGPYTPRDVVGLNAGAFAVDGGRDSTCVYLQDGNLRCFGLNNVGQLGDGGPVTERETPVAVFGLSSGVTQISVGGNHSCARQSSGAIKCWGLNLTGQLGIGDLSFTEPLPQTVSGYASGGVAVSAGDTHSCAVGSGGGARCWGDNSVGQLGTDVVEPFNALPQPVFGLTSGVTTIAAGFRFSCAFAGAAGDKCWGDGGQGQLGAGTPGLQGSFRPLDVTGTLAITQFALGSNHACAIVSGGAVWCWGSNALGQLGTGGTPASAVDPIALGSIPSGAIAIASHAEHTCIVQSGTGQVRCWGRNDAGQLGNGNTNDAATPVNASLTGAIDIAVGRGFSCALLQSGGSVRCVGLNSAGQLGNGTLANSLTWVPVQGLMNVVDIDAGDAHACAVTAGGAAFCWGDALFGQLGNGDAFLSPVPTAAFLLGGSGIENVGSFTGDADADSNDRGGFSVAQTDDFVVMGAPGAGVGPGEGAGEVYIYQRVRSKAAVVKAAKALTQPKLGAFRTRYRAKNLVPVALLFPPNGQPGDKFGQAVAINGSGTTIVVGGPDAGSGDVGQAFVFRQPAGGWFGTPAPSAILNPINNTQVPQWDGFGASVAIGSDGTIVVGAPDSDVVSSGAAGKAPIGDKWGAAASFRDDGASVSPTGTLTPPGQPQNDANFGASVAIGGGRVVIGAPNMDVGGAVDAGMVVAYTASNGTVSAPQPLTAPGGAPGDKWGAGVAVGGTGTIVVGAPGDDTPQGADSGSATVLFPFGGTLAPAATLLPMAGAAQGAGAAVASSGDTILLGAPNATDDGLVAEGMVYAYALPVFAGPQGQPPAQLPEFAVRNPGGAAGDQFGSAVSASASGFLVGVPFDDRTVADTDQGRAEAFGFDRILRASFEGN